MRPAATISQSQITGAPVARAAAPASAAPGEKARRSATSGMPQACTTRAASVAIRGEKRSSRASLRTAAKLSA